MSSSCTRERTVLLGRRWGVGSALWLGDVRRVLMTNLLAYADNVWMVTVTAPGAELLPWACELDGCAGARARAKGGCGICGCRRVEPAAAREWNRTAQARWSELQRWARQAVLRELGRPPTSLARVWQLQARGVLHLHGVLGFGDELERIAAKLYVSKLRSRAAEFGFGFIDARDRGDGSTVMAPERAAGYLASYLANSKQLLEAVAIADRPRRLIWVSPALTSSTKCTMRRLRRVRFLWHLRREVGTFVRAGTSFGVPKWFRDAAELAAVHALLRPEPT